MVPDLPIFTSFDYYALSHSLSGLVLFNLPIGLLLWFFWTYVLRRPTSAFCPSPLRKALFSRCATPHYVTILLSLVLGAATHQLWDGFTHRTGFFVTYAPGLLSEVAGYPLYSWLQFLSSLFGLGVLAFWVQRKWDKTQSFTLGYLTSMFVLPVTSFGCAVFYATQVRRLNDGIVFIYGVVISSTKIMVACYLFSVSAYYLICWIKLKIGQKNTALTDS
jgi:general stress protein CsbA